MKSDKLIYIGAAALALLLFIPAVAGGSALFVTAAGATDLFNIAANFTASQEGFSSTPYWDVSRWSWGYGTAAPGSTGTISQAQALSDMNAVLQESYNYLSGQITRQLTANQWAALLDFDYNEGEGNADNLISDINANNDAALESHWKEYIYAGGVISSDLVSRRNKEWVLWQS